MSKTAIFLVILVAVIGVAIGWHYGFSPFQTIQSFIQNPSSLIEWIKGIPQTVWIALASGIGGIITGILALARNVTQYKQQQQENLNQIRSDLTTQNMQLQTEKQAAQTNLQETTKTYSDNFATLSENYVKLQDELSEAQAANKQLLAERDYYYNEAKKLEAKLKEPAHVP